MVVSAEAAIDKVLEPGEFATLLVDGKLESLVACALVAGIPDGVCRLMMDTDSDFDLQRGPFQWYRNGHLLPNAFEHVAELAVENTGDEPVRVMVLVGYTPAAVPEPDGD